ncbi:DUF4064 domain-containing protein [Virgibacillus dokdonensis]|uniref:DUF4064 domain-containing protein n=1 Tax=Virgibacillus dokdonensis TaxID=302167 RepID=A0A2K9J2A3_9BACI|nr:DUF4064 domain-containing protein [Virgibacillus dokdonensis]AUJ26078.1 hypothetical protein A21D_03036 [Virgibacillus dokdonensis]
MKRTGEIVFTVIGILLFGILIFGSATYLSADSGEIQQLFEEVLQEEGTNEVSAEDLSQTVESAATTMLIVSIVSVIFGLISIFLLVGNKKPKIAGVILLITAIGGTFLTMFFGSFGGVVYLVAGIMALVRKEKKMIG